MAAKNGTVICPDCSREIRATQNRHDSSGGRPVKHKNAGGTDCDGHYIDFVDWKRWPGSVPPGWRSPPPAISTETDAR